MKQGIDRRLPQRSLRRRLLQVFGGTVLIIVVLLATAQLWLPAIGYWLARPADVHLADAVVVFDGGNPERLQQAVILYQQGFAPELWHTGDVVWPDEPISDAQVAARRAIAQGVPAEAIHLLPTTSTWEDGQQVAALARQRHSTRILLVTDWWHSHRAVCSLRQQLDSNVTIYFSPARSSFSPKTWWHSATGREAVIGEVLASGYYWLRYGMVPWGC